MSSKERRWSGPVALVALMASCLGPRSAAAQAVPEEQGERPGADSVPPVAAFPEENEAPAEESSRAQRSGVQILIFVGSTPAAGVLVSHGDGAESASTNENGSVSIEALPGSMTLRVVMPRAYVPDAPGEGAYQVDLGTFELAPDRIAEVVATLDRAGKMESLLVEGAQEAGAGDPGATAEAGGEPARLGKLTGVVRALEGKKPIEGAKIYARGAAVEGTTDAAGRFELELPEGEWDLSIIHSDFATESRSGVLVSSEETNELEIELTPASVTLDDFVVTAPHIEGSVAAYMDERRESASLTDAITSEDIARTPAGDAAGAAQRVVGVTIVDGRFVYVRGLGERYTNALVNGSTLPSPEPDKATVPLDLFPTQTIRSIDIAKTFTPDMPADFAGGSVRLETITVPERPLFSFSLKAGWNSQATFRERLSYEGSSTDWLGFDNGRRALPDEIPRGYQLTPGNQKPNGDRLGRTEITDLGPTFDNPMGTIRELTPPNHGGSMMLGNGWDLGGKSRLGAVAALTYGRKYTIRDETIREFTPAGQGASQDLDTWIDARREVGRETVRWGAFGSLGLDLGEHHKLSLIGLRSQLADDTTSVFRGFSRNSDGSVANSRLDFTSRELNFGQMRGVHEFTELYDAELDWRLSLATAALDQPDMRDSVYFRGRDSDAFSYLGGNSSGRHFYADMEETARAVFADWTQPIVQGDLPKKLKFGGAVNSKDRTFRARRFSFRKPSRPDERLVCGPEYDSERCPSELFVPENTDGSLLALQEDTAVTDAYRASTDIYAGYLMGDAQLTQDLRVIAGARVESTNIRLASFDQFSGDEITEDAADLTSVDWLPSASLIYSLAESLEARAAVSRTLARPQLRELAPFTFQDYFGGALLAGDPDLEITQILNADLRMDYFPSPQEVVSISVFAKDFTNPIEPVLQPSSSVNFLQFRNAKGAFLVGLELEARKGLEFLSEALEDFSLLGNLTLATSRIEVEQTGMDTSGVGFLTNTERAMVNQAPYVVNLALDYTGPSETNVRLLYNIAGKRIVSVGVSGLDDSYLQPQHQLDLNVSREVVDGVQLGFSAENILNAKYMVTQGPERREDRVTYSYRNGVVLSVSAGYSY